MNHLMEGAAAEMILPRGGSPEPNKIKEKAKILTKMILKEIE